MDDLFLFIDCCHTDVFLIVEIILIYHICLVNKFLVIFAFVSLFIRLCLIPTLKLQYCAVSSYLGFLNAKFFLLRPLLAS